MNECIIPTPFLQYIGAKFIQVDKQGCSLELEITEHLTNSWGVGHGGVLVSLMDNAMSLAARFYNEPAKGVATLEIKTSFFMPALGKLNCYGYVVHKTQTLAFCEAYIQNKSQQIIAKASTSFKYLKKFNSFLLKGIFI